MGNILQLSFCIFALVLINDIIIISRLWSFDFTGRNKNVGFKLSKTGVQVYDAKTIAEQTVSLLKHR